MNKYTLYQKIYRTLEASGEWTPAYNLEKVQTEWGWIGSSGSRRCRELAEQGKIERRVKGKYVEYRVVRNPTTLLVNRDEADRFEREIAELNSKKEDKQLKIL